MPFKSIKNKINSIASGEILGETTDKNVQEEKQVPKREPKPKPKKEKVKKEPKSEKAPKERKVSKESFFKRKEIDVEEEVIQTPKVEEKPQEVDNSNKMLVREAVDGYEDVLAILNIKENIELKLDFESKDLDYVEFSQTTPLGFDFDEVTDFISRMKYILNKHELTLKQRNKEIVILASEVKKVEQRMVEQNQAKELEKMVGGMTEEERLIEENMDLRVELNKLKAQINNKGENSEIVEKLKKEIDALRAENELLTLKKVQVKEDNSDKSFKLPTVETPNPPNNTLPSFDIDKGLGLPDFIEEDEDLDKFMDSDKPNKDAFESMMNDIGGNYND